MLCSYALVKSLLSVTHKKEKMFFNFFNLTTKSIKCSAIKKIEKRTKRSFFMDISVFSFPLRRSSSLKSSLTTQHQQQRIKLTEIELRKGLRCKKMTLMIYWMMMERWSNFLRGRWCVGWIDCKHKFNAGFIFYLETICECVCAC